jgi:copper chaperone CopZ
MPEQPPLVLIDLGVGGMTCDDCVVRVETALEAVPGVESAAVDLAARRALVRARPDVAGTALAAAVRAAGPPAGHRYNAFERARRPVDPTQASGAADGGR